MSKLLSVRTDRAAGAVDAHRRRRTAPDPTWVAPRSARTAVLWPIVLAAVRAGDTDAATQLLSVRAAFVLRNTRHARRTLAVGAELLVGAALVLPRGTDPIRAGPDHRGSALPALAVAAGGAAAPAVEIRVGHASAVLALLAVVTVLAPGREWRRLMLVFTLFAPPLPLALGLHSVGAVPVFLSLACCLAFAAASTSTPSVVATPASRLLKNAPPSASHINWLGGGSHSGRRSRAHRRGRRHRWPGRGGGEQVLRGAPRPRPQLRLDLGEGQFNGIEVRGVGGQEEQPGPDRLNGQRGPPPAYAHSGCPAPPPARDAGWGPGRGGHRR